MNPFENKYRNNDKNNNRNKNTNHKNNKKGNYQRKGRKFNQATKKRLNLSNKIYGYIIGFSIFAIALYSIKSIDKYLNDPQFIKLTQWFSLLILLNLMITIFILISYSSIKFHKGIIGPKGHQGVQGKQGEGDSCAICHRSVPVMKHKRDIVYNKPLLKEAEE